MLEAKKISFSYKNSSPLFSGFDLSIGSKERVAIKAPSGYGKSTLAKLLSGYLIPSSGEVLCNESPLPKKGISPVQLIWQHPELVIDPHIKIKKSLEEGGVPSDESLERLEVKREWLHRFPHELSGGELQRICIARAMATQPRYLIVDEMTTMLDAITQANIWRVLLSETERLEVGLMLVSHSPALTRKVATRVIPLI